MKTKLILSGAAILLLGVFAFGVFYSGQVGAQSAKADSDRCCSKRRIFPIFLNGHSWASKKEFLDHGRCTTKNLSDFELEQVEREVEIARDNRKAANGGFEMNATGGVIPVYVHVIRDSSGAI